MTDKSNSLNEAMDKATKTAERLGQVIEAQRETIGIIARIALTDEVIKTIYDHAAAKPGATPETCKEAVLNAAMHHARGTIAPLVERYVTELAK